MPAERRRVAVLGATGVVGQRLVRRLDGHPWFELVAVAASPRSVGRPYGEAARWLLPGAPPPAAAAMTLVAAAPNAIDAEMVLSALDSSAAAEVEPLLRAAGHTVVSNAAALRMEPDVPLVVPEVNPAHLELTAAQRRRWGGAVVTNPNCSTTGLVLALAPLERAFGLESVVITTLQALSGAGHPGVSSLDALGNVLPHIAGEEDKLEREPAKVLGALAGVEIRPHALRVSAQCNRVPVRDGHVLSVSVRLKRPADPDAARAAYAGFASAVAHLELPSAPARPVALANEANRPQPLLDLDAGAGMTVTVGRLQRCGVHDLRFVALVHNTERGAAGGTLLLAEAVTALGL